MTEFFSDVFKTVATISVPDVLDIALVAVLFYYLYKFLRDRRSGKLVVGIVLIIALWLISTVLNMYVTQFILQNLFQVGIIALVVVFQPELRSALEKVGGQPFKNLKNIGAGKTEPVTAMIETVSQAAEELGQTKTGALMVIERETKLGDMVLTGTVVDAEPSVSIIKNIFFNKAPLHDGALIIRDNRLYAAGCLLPLTSSSDIDGELGTRHRAAIGMSENSDSVVVVVSEETGIISLAIEGTLYRGYNGESLKKALRRYLTRDGSDTTKKLNKLYKTMKKNDGVKDNEGAEENIFDGAELRAENEVGENAKKNGGKNDGR